jgi:hypothetical protein
MGRDFPLLSRPALGPTQPPVQWVLGLSGDKERPERDTNPSPTSSAVVMKGQSYTSTPPIGRTACTEPQYLYKGALYLYLIAYSIFKIILFVLFFFLSFLGTRLPEIILITL